MWGKPGGDRNNGYHWHALCCKLIDGDRGSGERAQTASTEEGRKRTETSRLRPFSCLSPVTGDETCDQTS